MKTIEELYKEVISSEELRKEFLSLKPEGIEGFAEKHGCKATLDEIKAFLTEKSKGSGELSDDEIEQVAGGKSATCNEALWSTFTLGISCLFDALDSKIYGKSGTDIEGEGMLCEK